MSMIDVLIRLDAICSKYDKYDADKHRADAAGGDPFSRLYAAVDAEIDVAMEKSERAATERNRAAAVALNADVRRTKARLMEEAVKLRKLAAKKVKGLSPEEAELRRDLVSALPHRIQSIPDGGGGGGGGAAVGQNGGGNVRPGIKFDSSAEDLDEGYFQTSEESEEFRREYEMRRTKQDEGLEFISEGLDTLKNLAEDMNEELDRQVPLMDEIDNKVDKANVDLRKTNVRLKETVNQFRSTRNFIIDIILICVILGIAGYLYDILNQ
ncbi:syntaxin-71-like isoform X2 [Oryza brachyantha]|uniref:syntaxin-71-like isoform X2 n=1 Tax=Oryza brachyantha TaxID=4533 RepID=UPI001AD9AFA0|nr:syntaxin-71-like isoform X2 [Oryza brachyantha]